MKIFKLLALCTLLALLLVPAAVWAQEQAAPERGVVEFGFRGVTGEVYGRTQPGTVPFSNGFRPDLLNSALNTYQDNRTGFYIPKFNAQLDSLFGSDNYLRIQSASNGFAFQGGATLTRDQSVLVSFGQYGHYKLQFRYDQTPHIFSGTTRTLFSSGGPGVWNVNPALQASLYNALRSGPAVGVISTTINNAVAGTQVAGVPGVQLFTQQENRKTITGSLGWNITPDLNVSALFSREHQAGTRPIGFVMGSGSSAYVAEAPEAIDYYTNTVKVATEFGRKHWDASLGYQGSFFQNEIPSMLVMNPFTTPGNDNGTTGPASGLMDQYPDNSYHQFVGQGALDLGKRIHLMANVTPGWLSQTASFQSLTSNPSVSLTPPPGYPAYLPANNLNGKVDTLAMNYTAVFKATKALKFVAKYQHYNYDDNTPELLVRPVIGDTAFLTSFHGDTGAWYDPVNGYPGAPYDASHIYYDTSTQSSFTSKLIDLGGTWFFTKKSSVKFGYQRGWMDRQHREVAESIEDSFYGALDLHLHKDVLLRVSGRHQNRMPQGHEAYEADAGNFYARMPDQSTRGRNRGDVSLQWDATQKLSISAFWGTLQDNYNQRNRVNSLTPLGDTSFSPVKIAGSVATPIYGPYYAYGLLNNIGRNYGVDLDYSLTPKVVLFAEYAREKNTGVMVQGRALNPATGCIPTGSGFTISVTSCDPINDLLTANKDVVNSYYGGLDVTASKKLDVSLYYSLSAAQSFSNSDGVNCQIGDGPGSYCFDHFTNWKLDNLTSGGRTYQAVTFSYPQNVNRVHEVGAIARFKLTQNLLPKFQYIFRQYANNDWQTGVINPYSFVGTAIDPAGTTAVQKMLLLGADQPSYRAHVFSATLEYHF